MGVLLLLGRPGWVAAQGSVDPLRAALTTAVQKAALESAGTPAFHLEAKYETFDYQGEPLGAGTLVEDFLRPGLHKTTVREGEGGETYAPEDQAKIGEPVLASSGNFMQRLLVDMALRPGPSTEDLASAPLKEKNQKLGDVSLRCITLQPLGKLKEGSDRTPQLYCLSPDAPILRVAVQRYGLEVLYNRMASFGGHTVALDVTIRQRDKLRGHLQVKKLVAAPALTEADFPKGTAGVPGLDKTTGAASVDQAVIAGRLVKKVPPIYPTEAKQKHISGQVVLHVMISKDGSIEDLEIISGPLELVQSAMDAVSQWRYEPYLLAGKPTEVDTTVTVRYSFGP